MFLDEQGHVQWTGLTEYCDSQEAVSWRDKWGEGVPDAMKPLLEKWVNAKLAYDASKLQPAN